MAKSGFGSGGGGGGGGTTIIQGEITRFDTAKPANAVGNNGDQSLQFSGTLAGIAFEKSGGAWVWRGQWFEPKLTALPTPAQRALIGAEVPAGQLYKFVLLEAVGADAAGFYTIDSAGTLDGQFDFGGGAGGGGLPTIGPRELLGQGGTARTPAQYRADARGPKTAVTDLTQGNWSIGGSLCKTFNMDGDQALGLPSDPIELESGTIFVTIVNNAGSMAPQNGVITPNQTALITAGPVGSKWRIDWVFESVTIMHATAIRLGPT